MCDAGLDGRAVGLVTAQTSPQEHGVVCARLAPYTAATHSNEGAVSKFQRLRMARRPVGMGFGRRYAGVSTG